SPPSHTPPICDLKHPQQSLKKRSPSSFPVSLYNPIPQPNTKFPHPTQTHTHLNPNSPSNQIANLPPSSTPIPVGDKLLYNHHVPNTPISVYFILDTTHPIPLSLLARTIVAEKRQLLNHIAAFNNTYLSAQDDPYVFEENRKTKTKKGGCRIEMSSYHGPGEDKGPSGLTYRGVLDALQGVREVMVEKERSYEGFWQVENATSLVGQGNVRLVGGVRGWELSADD
ncbi:MAG: hypothetical protein Q9169_007993, partial [Polycauliona sp. 2 TL-2023]